MDGGPPPSVGSQAYPLRASPPPASKRALVAERIDTGVTAINTFVTCCRGQRLGIFAGSGVGKTTLLGMLARNVNADAIVIALVGERGKELSEFLERYLPAEVRRRAVVVLSTSDQTAILRRRAVLVAASIAEKLRDEGLHVAFFLDSLTRYAMALREIGLVAGEPVGPSGYPASVFAELPKVIERLGPGVGRGAITAYLTVLVEGDDMNEPVADAVRGIVDGHLVLDRKIADGGRYPAIDISRSVSRAMPHCNDAEEGRLISEALRLEAVYKDIEDLYKLSMYKVGSNLEIDQAINFHGRLEAMLAQPFEAVVNLGTGFDMLRSCLGSQS
jgi:flagellum-specific ATP synthase